MVEYNYWLFLDVLPSFFFKLMYYFSKLVVFEEGNTVDLQLFSQGYDVNNNYDPQI